jgi:hypothetical protein
MEKTCDAENPTLGNQDYDLDGCGFGGRSAPAKCDLRPASSAPRTGADGDRAPAECPPKDNIHSYYEISHPESVRKAKDYNRHAYMTQMADWAGSRSSSGDPTFARIKRTLQMPFEYTIAQQLEHYRAVCDCPTGTTVPSPSSARMLGNNVNFSVKDILPCLSTQTTKDHSDRLNFVPNVTLSDGTAVVDNRSEYPVNILMHGFERRSDDGTLYALPGKNDFDVTAARPFTSDDYQGNRLDSARGLDKKACLFNVERVGKGKKYATLVEADHDRAVTRPETRIHPVFAFRECYSKQRGTDVRSLPPLSNLVDNGRPHQAGVYLPPTYHEMPWEDFEATTARIKLLYDKHYVVDPDTLAFLTVPNIVEIYNSLAEEYKDDPITFQKVINCKQRVYVTVDQKLSLTNARIPLSEYFAANPLNTTSRNV